MITGVVTARYEAEIQLEVSDGVAVTVVVDSIIDTGFNGFLTLPTAIVQTLALPFHGSRDAVLADGSQVSLDIYRAFVMWDGRPRSIQVLAADGDPLVGMSMLRRHEVNFRIVPGGPVTIQPLP